MSLESFEGMGFLIAGGARGVGREVALAAALHGANVVSCDRRDREDSAAATMAAASALGVARRVSFVTGDVTSDKDVDHIFDIALERLPTFDVLVNNLVDGPLLRGGPLAEVALVDWNEVLRVNLRAPFLLSRRAIEEYLANGGPGRIIQIMPAIENGMAGRVAHAAVQTALTSLTRSIAKEYGRRGIGSNVVIIQGRADEETIEATSPSAISGPAPLVAGDIAGQPEVCAGVVLFLASSEASYVNGEVLHVREGARW